jgi:pimeloyl-ACP methyl ester carboxylesterase
VEATVTYSAAELAQHLKEAAELADLPRDEIVAPVDGTAASGPLNLHYLDWGRRGQPPVLFVHGRGLTAHTWDLVCLALRPAYHCVALDLRGHGDSDWSPGAEYGLDAQGADIDAVVEHLGLDRFILVGMSLGGAISLAYAGRNAARLHALVVVDIGPETRAGGARRIANFASASRELDSVEAFVERAVQFNPLRRPELLRRSLLHNLRQTDRGTWTWKYDDRVGAGQTDEHRARRREQLWDAVPRISCPTLVVRGGDSDVFHDEDAERLAAALPRGSWVRVDGAGHTVQGDQPRAFVEAVRPFLAGALT